MKIPIFFLLALFIALPAHALPRRQHLLHGKITAVDAAARSFTVESPTSGLVTLVWNDTTKLRDGKKPTPVSSLTPGRAVKLYYRTDLGVKVARDITLVSPPATASRPTATAGSPRAEPRLGPGPTFIR